MCRQPWRAQAVEPHVEGEDDTVGAEFTNPSLDCRRLRYGDAADDDALRSQRQ
jgi:hypothetical protein